MDTSLLVRQCYDKLVPFLSSLPNQPLGRYLKTLKQNNVFGRQVPVEQRAAIRASLIAMPAEVCLMIPQDVMASVDALLQAEVSVAKIVDSSALPQLAPSIAVWQGDMSLLRCDAVVNPGNNALLGCFLPSHKCLDNILHAQSGPRLRIACAQMLQQLGIKEDGNGQCRVTDAFALPSRYVFHTVGPCLLPPFPSRAPARPPTDADRRELRSCYETCLETAHQMRLQSIAFCCISTGIFGYPADEAAMIALTTTKEWLEAHKSAKEGEEGNDGARSVPLVVFNVFKDEDLAIYRTLVPQVFGDSVPGDAGAVDAPSAARAEP